eukprot:CAMPEP_0118944564 /NCGR_PEP_ID=MMETSP1169-20130426/40559_1 /TAXON_ID=36882 /ORGANISM="Pyramimonas obovata, Strain CCMP722" /LENGTH=36 /DNA_ID= /DNA_START= /DNA_END= /DNA_ORIENTATION=
MARAAKRSPLDGRLALNLPQEVADVRVHLTARGDAG